RDAFAAQHETAALHPGQLMRQAALLPVQRLADLEWPKPAFRRLAELHKHLVLREREPAVLLQLTVKRGRQQRAQLQVRAPRLLLIIAEPRPCHAASI